MTAQLTLSPLTSDECRDRYRETQRMAALRVMISVSNAGEFAPSDFTCETLTQYGRDMTLYRNAWQQRIYRRPVA